MEIVDEFKRRILENPGYDAAVVKRSTIWQQFLPVRDRLQRACIHYFSGLGAAPDGRIKRRLDSCPMLRDSDGCRLSITAGARVAHLDIQAVIFVHSSLEAPDQFGGGGAGEHD